MKPKVVVAIIVLASSTLLGACDWNRTTGIIEALDPAKLYPSFEQKTVDLAARSKCANPAKVNIVSAERRSAKYIFYRFTGNQTYIYFTPDKLIEHVVTYIKDAFNRCGIESDDKSGKTIKVYLGAVKMAPTGYAAGMEFQLKIEIPEIRYTKTYKTHEWSGAYGKGIDRAAANSLHVTVWKIIKDPAVQNYVLCRSRQGSK